MNGTTHAQGRSVQVAVMAAQSVTLAEGGAEPRRRHDTSGAWISLPVARSSFRPRAAAAG